MHLRFSTAALTAIALIAVSCDSPTESGGRRRANLLAGEKEVLVGFNQMPGAAEQALIASFGAAG